MLRRCWLSNVSCCRRTLAVTVVVLTWCWKFPTCSSSAADACIQDRLPPDLSVWNDDPALVNVSIVWTVEDTCASINQCFNGNMSNDTAIEHQLDPVYIQRGVSLWFQPATYENITVTLQYFVTDEVGFKNCNFGRGRILPGSSTALVSPDDLNHNLNYFIARSTVSPFFTCSTGLRMNVTVQDWRCGQEALQTTSRACSSRGTCAARPWATHYECHCCDGYSGDYCQVEPCTPDPCLNSGTCIASVSNQPTTFTCLCSPDFTGSLCETRLMQCDVNHCSNGGTCQSYNGTELCACADGYGGPTCDLQENVTTTDLGNETHTTPPPTATPATMTTTQPPCRPGFTGTSCEVNIDDCASAPCLNDGVCVDLVDGFRCDCSSDAIGVLCEAAIKAETDDSRLALILGIIAGVLIFILAVLLTLFIIQRWRLAQKFRRSRRKPSQRGAYYVSSRSLDYDGGYYNTRELMAAHPVPKGPEEPDWYWTSSTSNSYKSGSTTSPIITNPRRQRRV